jgi:hypothetical protein
MSGITVAIATLRLLAAEFQDLKDILHNHIDQFGSDSCLTADAFGRLDDSVSASEHYGQTASALIDHLERVEDNFSAIAERLTVAAKQYERSEAAATAFAGTWAA